jgi:predicted extracellular nuclease
MRSIFLLLLLLENFVVLAQEKAIFHAHTIAFYNVENLFDTINNPNTFDDDRTPKGKDRWTAKNYYDKLAKLGETINLIGRKESLQAPTIIGLAEIENRAVLEDLVASSEMQKNAYGIIHFDSPDARGIDVAMLYKKNVFIPLNFKKHALYIIDSQTNKQQYTRDQLVVSGLLEGEKISFIINHWPSRRGGEARSAYKRIAAAELNKKIIDSLYIRNSNALIINMGDFNDDPTNKSLKEVLKGSTRQHAIDSLFMYNPMLKMHKKGMGTLAYRDSWNLFDQLLLSPSLAKKNDGLYFWKAGIFNPDMLITQKGRYKGYPFRSYANGNYVGGYSDHFPVYIILVKRLL